MRPAPSTASPHRHPAAHAPQPGRTRSPLPPPSLSQQTAPPRPSPAQRAARGAAAPHGPTQTVAAASRAAEPPRTPKRFNDRNVVMVSVQNKWARRRKIALADLIDEPWVLPSAETVVGMDIAKVFRASGLEPPVAHVVSFSIPLHYHLLATDRLITMLPLSMTVFGRRDQPVDCASSAGSAGEATSRQLLKRHLIGYRLTELGEHMLPYASTP